MQAAKSNTPEKDVQKEKSKKRAREIAELLINNREFVESTNQKHPTFFKTLGMGHSPKYLMIGCSDARIQPNSLLRLNPGELFIHRNIANQVFQGDLNANSAIQYAVEGLGIRDIIVMGHSKCGGVMASMKSIPFNVVDQWISSIREIYETHKTFFKDMTEEERSIALAKVNVRHQCMNIIKGATMRRARQNGIKVRVHGWFLDVSTGMIEELKFSAEYTRKITEIYSDTLLRLSTSVAETKSQKIKSQTELQSTHAHSHTKDSGVEPVPASQPQEAKAAPGLDFHKHSGTEVIVVASTDNKPTPAQSAPSGTEENPLILKILQEAERKASEELGLPQSDSGSPRTSVNIILPNVSTQVPQSPASPRLSSTTSSRAKNLIKDQMSGFYMRD